VELLGQGDVRSQRDVGAHAWGGQRCHLLKRLVSTVQSEKPSCEAYLPNVIRICGPLRRIGAWLAQKAAHGVRYLYVCRHLDLGIPLSGFCAAIGSSSRRAISGVAAVKTLGLRLVELVDGASECSVGRVVSQLRVGVAERSPIANEIRCPKVAFGVHVERFEGRISVLDAVHFKVVCCFVLRRWFYPCIRIPVLVDRRKTVHLTANDEWPVSREILVAVRIRTYQW
jgi:hypothetical protein